MGAVSAIKYQHQHQGASCLVLDSPYHSLAELMTVKICEMTFCPYFVAKTSISILQGFISDKAKFNID